VSLPRPVADALAAALAPLAALYIAAQRRRMQRGARALLPDERERLRPYFSPQLLDAARVTVRRSIGMPDIPGLVRAAAITFGPVIAARAEPDACLLCHELVHVAQYRALGVRRFACLYLRGFLRAGSYDEIPLERCAYALGDRFAADGPPFAAEAEIERWIAAERL